MVVHVRAERGGETRKLCGAVGNAGASGVCPLCPSLNPAMNRTARQRGWRVHFALRATSAGYCDRYAAAPQCFEVVLLDASS